MHLKFGCESYEINNLLFSWKKSNLRIVSVCWNVINSFSREIKNLDLHFDGRRQRGPLKLSRVCFANTVFSFIGMMTWVIWSQAGRNGWSVLDSWSISMWPNFPVWARSIACLVRPLTYIFSCPGQLNRWHCQSVSQSVSQWATN